MQVISLVSSKGGSSKSTLAAELACAAEQAGAGPVALVDIDPQCTTTRWWHRRGSDTPVLATLDGQRLRHGLDGLEQKGFRCVVFDTPGYSAASVPAVIAVSDLVIVPVRPTPDDLETVATTLEPIERASKPVCFVVSGTAHNARLAASTVSALAAYDGVVAPVHVHTRQSVPQARIEGLSVTEAEPNGKAAAEFRELWQYVAARLAKTAVPKGKGRIRRVA